MRVLYKEGIVPPLIVAAAKGSKEVVQMLLDAGADGNAQGGQYGNPLQAVFYKGSVQSRTAPPPY